MNELKILMYLKRIRHKEILKKAKYRNKIKMNTLWEN